MVRYIAIITLFFSLQLSAAEQLVNLEFNAISIPELSQLVLKGLLKRDYAISPEVLEDKRKMTLSLKNQNQKQVLSFFKSFLAQNDIVLEETNSIIYVKKANKSPITIIENNPKPPQLDTNNTLQNAPITKLETKNIRFYKPYNR